MKGNLAQYSLVILSNLLLLNICFAEQKQAATSQDAPWQIIFQLDNDLFAGEDKDYTNGARLGFIKELDKNADLSHFFEKQLRDLSGADRNTLLRARLKDPENLRFAYGTGLTQLMFTPDDHLAPSAPKGQRPYAGWLGLEFSLHAKNNYQVSSVTFSIGTTGNSSLAEETQQWVHEHISDSPTYQGWDSQIPDQVTLNLNFDHKRRITFLDRLKTNGITVDGYYEWGAALGNFRTNTYAGALMRAGYNLPATYSTPRVQLGSYGHELFRAASTAEQHQFSSLIFIGARTTAVAFDITLDGPLWSNFDTGVDSKPVVGELIAGFGLHYGFIGLSFSHTLRSDEFNGQNKNQQFGSVMLRMNSSF